MMNDEETLPRGAEPPLVRALVGRTSRGDRDVVVVASVDTQIGAIAERLDLAGGVVLVDGARVDGSEAWGERVRAHGSLVEAAPTVAGGELAPPVGFLVQRAGLTSGTRIALPPGTFALGEVLAQERGLHTSPVGVPELWCDVGAGGAAQFHDGLRTISLPTVRTRGAAFSFDSVAEPALRSEDTKDRLVSRPPRVHHVHDDTAVEIADGPPPVPDTVEFSWAAFLAPVPIGLLMAVLFRPMFALFALMGPVTALARLLENRRRRRRAQRAHDRYQTVALAELRPVVAARSAAEASSRRQGQPGAADLFEWAACRNDRLWERRPVDDDFLVVSVGLADESWMPDFTPDLPAFASAVMVNTALLREVPLRLAIGDAAAVGIVGERPAALSVARSIVLQLATLQGPADVRVHLVCDGPRTDSWDWCKWLPHLSRSAPTSIVSAAAAHDRVSVLHLVERLKSRAPESSTEHVDLLIVDSADLMTGSDSALRDLVQGESRVHALVIGETMGSLPAQCDHIVQVADDGGTMFQPASGAAGDSFLPEGVTDALARDWARQLAPLVDAELADASSAVPEAVSLLGLRGDSLTPRAIAAAWERNTSLAVPLGAGRGGPVDVDLAVDGPHALVAGTTGAGKSELLRSLVASLTLQRSARDVNFVLIDFKGGGAFDVCADLPHVVAVVTDLDDHLAARALRSLQAEMRRREQALRESGSSDLPGHNGALADEADPSRLARLIVIVDEFATLAAELPVFLDALVDIAQRGRSLGLHLVLATQRPAGVVDQKIRANTNLRIALRVQDAHDSIDVIGSAVAADLDPRRPGRAYVRAGGTEPRLMQAGLVTAPTIIETDAPTDVHISSFRLEGKPPPHKPADDAPLNVAEVHAGTDLDRIVAAVGAAHVAAELPTPHRPWLPPLPLRIAPDDLTEHMMPADRSADLQAVLGVGDVPDEQRRELWSWRPEAGSLLIYGIDADLAQQVIASTTIEIATNATPGQCHLYLIGAGSPLLAKLSTLPHVGAVVDPTDVERVTRIVDRLHEDAFGVGRAERTQQPQAVLGIDNYAAVVDALNEAGRIEIVDRLARVLREGSPLGISSVVGARNERAVPLRIASQIDRRLIGRLADPAAVAAFGLRAADVPALPAHRVVDPSSGRLIQLVVWDEADIDSALAAIDMTGIDGPGAVAVLASHITRIEMTERCEPIDVHSPRPVNAGAMVPVGIDRTDLTVTHLAILPGQHLLIAGPRTSGRTTGLLVLAHGLRDATDHWAERPTLMWVGRADELGPASDRFDHVVAHAEFLPSELAEIIESAPQPIVVFVDDAEEVEPGGPADALRNLVSARSDRLTVVAASTPDFVRRPGAWVQPMRNGRSGIMLAPTTYDNDIFRLQLPAVSASAPQGRGVVIINGVAAVTQFADLV